MKLSYEQATDSFIKYLQVEKGYSQGTVSEYARDLRTLGEYAEFPEDVNDLDMLTISNFLADLVIERDIAPTTRNRKLYSIRSFYKFMVKKGYIEKNPALRIDSTKERQTAEPVFLNQNEIRALLEAVEKDNASTKLRDIAILKTMLYCGLRISELVNLKISDVDFEGRSIKFYGKGAKERYVPLHPEAVTILRTYLNNYRSQMKAKTKKDTDYLFLSNHRRKFSVRSIQYRLKKYTKLAGIKKNVTPHTLRHTFASLFYKTTKDLIILQQLLGHSNISTTQIYTHTNKEEKHEAIEQLSLEVATGG